MIRPGLREWFAVGRVFANGHLLRTDAGLRCCERFETELAAFTGASHTLAVSSGTAGLVCALQALGIGPGDEVLVPAYTWMATAGAVLLVGAVPVLVEIDASLTMDPQDLVAKIGPRSRAVIPVHMINRPCDMDAILDLARRCGLRVIEDASQAIGATYKGRQCGTMGDMGVFSFNQHKNMTCGEGGAVLTSDPQLYWRAKNAHDMGISFRGSGDAANMPVFVGANYRISEIQGAILRVQLKKLPGRLRRMRRRAAVQARALRGRVPLAPHHDAGGALGIAVTFDSEAEAQAFAARRGARRLFDNSKHVYTQWHPILQRSMPQAGFDPWSWAGVAEERPLNDCPRTLDLLRRSCAVNPMPQAPVALVRLLAARMAG